MVVVSLLTTSTTGLVSMLRIREKAGQTFVERLETDLATAVTSKAETANAEFRRYTGYVGLFADYIHELYVNPAGYSDKEILPPTYNDRDRLVMKR